MSKIIFQIGLLAFCIAAVVYASLGMTLLDIIARAFIIFIVTIGALIGIVFASSMFSDKDEKHLHDADHSSHPA